MGSSVLRWAILAILTGVGGWIMHQLGELLVELVAGGSPGVLRTLLAAYAALASGFLFSALLTRLAPARRYMVAVGMVFVMVLVAATLMLGHRPQTGPLPTVVLGISLVVGAFGYALRVRGFSETVSGREL
jgi:hypothetical protein